MQINRCGVVRFALAAAVGLGAVP